MHGLTFKKRYRHLIEHGQEKLKEENDESHL